jgi:hypothetical protein
MIDVSSPNTSVTIDVNNNNRGSREGGVPYFFDAFLDTSKVEPNGIMWSCLRVEDSTEGTDRSMGLGNLSRFGEQDFSVIVNAIKKIAGNSSMLQESSTSGVVSVIKERDLSSDPYKLFGSSGLELEFKITNKRRVELIMKKMSAPLTSSEAGELSRLQRNAKLYVKQAFPINTAVLDELERAIQKREAKK